jgi:hypothetical protein
MGTSGHKSLTSKTNGIPLKTFKTKAGKPTVSGVDVAKTKSISFSLRANLVEYNINLMKDKSLRKIDID